MLNIILNNMKRVNSFMIAALIAVCAGFSSCEDDLFEKPTIDVYINGNFSEDGEYTAGGNTNSVTVKVEVKSETKLKEINIQKAGGDPLTGYPMTKGFDPSDKMHIQNNITVQREKTDGSKEKIIYNVTVNAKSVLLPVSKAIVINFEGVSDISESTIDLSCASYGGRESCFASVDGSKYTISAASSYSSQIDFLYYGEFGTLGLYSPSVAKNQTIIEDNWSTLNTTKLQRLTTVSSSQFDGAKRSSEIGTMVPSISDGSVAGLSSGNIVGFITAGGKKGLIKVNSVTESNINISVKVQK